MSSSRYNNRSNRIKNQNQPMANNYQQQQPPQHQSPNANFNKQFVKGPTLQCQPTRSPVSTNSSSNIMTPAVNQQQQTQASVVAAVVAITSQTHQQQQQLQEQATNQLPQQQQELKPILVPYADDDKNKPNDNDTASMVSDETGSINANAATTKTPWLNRGLNRKKLSVRVRRIRRNRRLRKMLTPKNGLMALNELIGSNLSEFNIYPDEKGFLAEVLVNNIRYEGRGSSKIAAKNDASEKALRDLIIQKMLLKPRSTKVNAIAGITSPDGSSAVTEDKKPAAAAKDEDEIMKDANNDSEDDEDEEEVPMMHLASFALYKLFSDWQSDGFVIPDFKTVTPSNNGGVGGNSTGDRDELPTKKIPVEKTDLPPNAESMHPTMLLSVMRPSAVYVDLGSEGHAPNILHRIGLTLSNNQQYIGVARSKKLARKAASIDACNALFNTNFVVEPVPVLTSD